MVISGSFAYEHPTYVIAKARSLRLKQSPASVGDCFAPAGLAMTRESGIISKTRVGHRLG
jgi:hypothetical protein